MPRPRRPAAAQPPSAAARRPGPRGRPRCGPGRSARRRPGPRPTPGPHRPPLRSGRPGGTSWGRGPARAPAGWPPTTAASLIALSVVARTASCRARTWPWTKPRRWDSAASTSTSARPVPSKAASSCSYFAMTPGPRGGRLERGDLREPRVPLEQRPVVLGHRGHPSSPRAAAPPGAGHAQVEPVDHEVEQLGLARDVGVDGHRRQAGGRGDRAHRHRVEPVAVGQADGGVDDVVHRPRPARPSTGRPAAVAVRLPRPVVAPQQRQGTARLAAAGAFASPWEQIVATSTLCAVHRTPYSIWRSPCISPVPRSPSTSPTSARRPTGPLATWASQEEMAADGFASLAHPEAGFNLIYLRVGLETFKPASAAGPCRRAAGRLHRGGRRRRAPAAGRRGGHRRHRLPRPSRGVSGTCSSPTPTASSTSWSSGSSRPTRSTPAEPPQWTGAAPRRGAGSAAVEGQVLGGVQPDHGAGGVPGDPARRGQRDDDGGEEGGRDAPRGRLAEQGAHPAVDRPGAAP